MNGRVMWAPLALVVAALGVLPWLLSRRAGCFGLGLLVFVYLIGYGAAFILHGYAVAPYPLPYPRPAATRDARWQQDVRYLGSELARLHVNAFHTTPEETYRAEIDRLEAAVPELSDAQLAVEMMRMTAMVGDAHTRFSADGRIPLDTLPVDLRWYSDGLYVRGISPLYPSGLGARVVKIGALSAEEAYQAVLPFIPHENDAWARLQGQNYLNLREVLAAIGASPGPGPVMFTLERTPGQAFTLEIAPLEPGETVDYLSAVEHPAFYQSRPDEYFWFDYREDTRSLYFRYAACVDVLGFRTLMQDLWKVVDEQPVERLIVDLRANGGGNSFQFERYFMPGLAAHPQLDHPDKLFVLIDRGTFSSASDNAVYLRLHSQARFVGEPTGGKPNSYGEVRQFRLPNSRASVSYSTNYFQLMEIDPDSLEPDVYVPVPAEAAFSGQDPLLEMLIPMEDW
jgi:hypothetical protein